MFPTLKQALRIALTIYFLFTAHQNGGAYVKVDVKCIPSIRELVDYVGMVWTHNT